jgi:hypothetical protein
LTHKKQVRKPHRCICRECRKDYGGKTAKEHRQINRLLSVGDESQKRLIAGYLADQKGRGGVVWISEITGMSRNTIHRGQIELGAPGSFSVHRRRSPGGGRKQVEKKVPHLKKS